jgi:hypothetical protein
MTEFSDHALRRMKQRNITVDQVEQAMARPVGLPTHRVREDTVEQAGLPDEGGILNVVRSRRDGRVVSVWWRQTP